MFADSLVALVTPMTADEALDLPAWQRLIEFHIAHGTAGVVVGGTTGESATITEAEVLQLVREAQAVAAGRLQVIAGAGSPRPRPPSSASGRSRRCGPMACWSSPQGM